MSVGKFWSAAGEREQRLWMWGWMGNQPIPGEAGEYLFGISSYNFMLNRLINKEVQGLYSKTNKHRDCSPKGRSKVA